jgi:hypothetical protein
MDHDFMIVIYQSNTYLDEAALVCDADQVLLLSLYTEVEVLSDYAQRRRAAVATFYNGGSR